MLKHWPRDPDQAIAFAAKRKKAAKVIGTCEYTPSASMMLAGILCNLAEDTEQRKLEVLNCFTKIVRGK